jgi:hypothetical protein
MRALSIALLCSWLVLLAAEKGPATARGANGKVEIAATLYAGPEAVREQLGSDLGGFFFVVKVDLKPLGGQPLAVNRSDFMLRSYKNGQRCQPYEPSQIAGSGGLTLSPKGATPVVAPNPDVKEDPVLAVLKSKILPEKKTAEPVSGLLYFSLEGKYKPKDLVLQYQTPAGTLRLAFR